MCLWLKWLLILKKSDCMKKSKILEINSLDEMFDLIEKKFGPKEEV